MSKYLTPAQQELLKAMAEANEVSQRSEVTKRDEARLSFLLAKIKALTAGAIGGKIDDECKRFFSDLLKGHEMRTVTYMEAGAQTPAYTAGPEGGFLVPQEFHDSVVTGMKQFDPLLNKDIVTLIESGNGSLKPYNIPGWDLSTFKAVKVAEGVQSPSLTPPVAATTILNGFKYMASLPVSVELEEDSFETVQLLMSLGYGVGFARGIGEDLVTGNGISAPQGVLTGASDSGVVTANTGKVVLDDIEDVYFLVDRYHRAAPKCAWLMNDIAYEQVRKAVDGNGRPLLNVAKDMEVLMSKPVYISPSLPEYNPSLGTQADGSFCVFGDLSYMFVRVSKLVIKRQWQVPGYVENGVALYTGIMRADAKVFDPTGGTTPPIVFANLKS
jgi:HK97 family phage major capsid protein